MHRLDICTALDRTPHLTADHDGVIVADLVSEWADRHGKDFTLHLTGPVGGTWTAGTAGQRIELDAVGFCRVIAKRPGPVGFTELMSTAVPY
jgi:hypothetical protein